jgi:hypothetical protein
MLLPKTPSQGLSSNAIARRPAGYLGEPPTVIARSEATKQTSHPWYFLPLGKEDATDPKHPTLIPYVKKREHLNHKIASLRLVMRLQGSTLNRHREAARRISWRAPNRHREERSDEANSCTLQGINV